ncbi:MFS transporter [Azorhizobium oxalatiphilum]|uniref:MFS transporter n=1 Tax=Azorhizobium oxalatiphilum TaxID=980631 RepID=A0A917FCW9_9HYPH|nr:tripartite tricarboxylate transporter substrate binding protein [Azorhizobium oxalatiphilum]GGF71489.1 MFS transporter [Azorhizobium oxalatiphilum]
MFRSMTCAMAAVFAAGLALSTGSALAESNWPSRAISIIVPYSAGGATDILARKVGQELSSELGQPVVIDNRAGGGGITGTMAATNARPDGYTLFFGQVSSHGIAPNLSSAARYDPVKGFEPIVFIDTIPNILVVRKDLPVNSVDELIAYAKANPDKLNFASSGTGASTHLSGEMFKAQAGVKMVHIPFPGSSQALTSIVAGQTDLMFDNMPSAWPQVSSGRVKALAVTSKARSPLAPDLPTMSEAKSADLSKFEATAWFGLFAPAGTPKDVITKVNTAVNRMLKKPEMIKFIQDGGGIVDGGTPQDLAKQVETELAKWKVVIDTAGIPKE